jgi:uncharacterized protein YybS (DUF2232 family)
MFKRFTRRWKIQKRHLKKNLGPLEDWESSLFLSSAFTFVCGTALLVKGLPQVHEYLGWTGLFLLELALFPFITIAIWYADKVEKRS